MHSLRSSKTLLGIGLGRFAVAPSKYEEKLPKSIDGEAIPYGLSHSLSASHSSRNLSIMLWEDMNGVVPEAIMLLLVSLVSCSRDSLTKAGVVEAQRSASKLSRNFDTKPGDDGKEVDLGMTDVVDSSDKWLEMGVIAVSV